MTNDRSFDEPVAYSVATDCPGIKPIPGTQIWTAKPADIPIGDLLYKEWRKEIQLPLVSDIEATLKAPNAAATILLWSAEVNNSTKWLEMRLTTWISCSSEKCCKILETDLRSRNYLNGEQNERYQLHFDWHGKLGLASRTMLSFTIPLSVAEQQGHDMPFGYSLYLHMQDDPDLRSSACGRILLLTLTRNGSIVKQCISTIGGVISVDGVIYGLTTAHAIFDIHTVALQEAKELELESTPSFDSDGENGLTSDDEEFSQLKSSRWTGGSSLKAARYGREDFRNGKFLGDVSSSKVTDYALVEMASLFGHKKAVVENAYECDKHGTMTTVNGKLPESQLSEGPVLILQSPKYADICRGKLLSSNSIAPITTGYGTFWTRTILLDGKLRKWNGYITHRSHG